MKCSPRHFKVSKIFPEEHAPGPPYKFVSVHFQNAPPPPPPPRKILATRLDFHEMVQIIHVSRGTKKTNHASHAFSHESRLFFGCFHASRISSWPDHPLRINTLLPSTRTRFNFLYRLLSLFKKFPYIHCIKMIICPTFVSNDPLAQSVERGANNAKAACSRLIRTTFQSYLVSFSF